MVFKNIECDKMLHSIEIIEQAPIFIIVIIDKGMQCRVFRDKFTYAKHDDTIAEGRDDQDELLKLNIPTSERQKILEKLEQHNVNAFSLLGSEESLMETLSFKEIFFRRL